MSLFLILQLWFSCMVQAGEFDQTCAMADLSNCMWSAFFKVGLVLKSMGPVLFDRLKQQHVGIMKVIEQLKECCKQINLTESVL